MGWLVVWGAFLLDFLGVLLDFSLRVNPKKFLNVNFI
jgi:hypothetical protein